MIRNLFIITGAGLLLAAVCFGGAFALGGREMIARGGWSFEPGHMDCEGFDCVSDATPVRIASRTLAWTGGDTLDLDLPADVEFVQGAEAGVAISGPERLVNAVALANGRLSLPEDALPTHVSGIVISRSERLRIRVTAPAVEHFMVRGSGDLNITGYDRPRLALTLEGSGDVTAAGRTQALEVDLSGSGDADLAALAAVDAAAHSDGSGDVELNATGAVTLALSGSGDVDLAARPQSLSQTIRGSGDVHQPG